MPIAQLRPIAAFAAFSAAAAMISSCGNADHPPETSVKSASPDGVVAHSSDRATPDPCTLLSASEAQVYVGVLSTPPYRATDDGAADAAGDACLYRGSGARQLAIVRTGPGAAQAGKIINDVPNMVGGALEKAGAGNLAAAAHRVMADVS